MRLLGALVSPVRRVVRFVRATHRTVSAVPDLVDAVLLLPAVAHQLQVVAFQTATLHEMRDEIVRLHGLREDTRNLPHIEERLAEIRLVLDDVQANTLAVQQLADVAVPLAGAALRVGKFADRIPQRRRPPGGQPL